MPSRRARSRRLAERRDRRDVAGGGRRGGVGGVDRRDEVAVDAERLVDLALDLLGDLDVLGEERLGVVAPLAESLVAVGEERTGLRHDVVLDAEVDEAAGSRDALAELDVELGLAERRRDLVLDDLHAHAVADRLGALLERLDATDVQALRRVELERATTGLRLRGAELDA